MPFLIQGKTNWKFLLIVIILAIMVGGGVLWFSMKKEEVSPELTKIETPAGEIPEGEVISEKEIKAFAKTYGGDKSEYLSSIQQTPDKGYIVIGTTGSFGAGDADFLVIKLDSSGNVVWSKTYGGNDIDNLYSVYQTSEGEYVIAGGTYSFGVGDKDVVVIKLDSSGNIIWSKTYGASNEDYARSIQPTSDGGYIVAGETWPYGSAGLPDILLIKISPSGDINWSKTYGEVRTEEIASIQQTADGGYIMGGTTDSFGARSRDFLIIKLDSSGNITWSKTYGGDDKDEVRSIQQTSDNGYIITGTTKSFGAGENDFLIIKLDSSGDVIWSKTYGGSKIDLSKSVYQNSDGGYIVAGTTESFGAGKRDFLIMKLDSSGNITWSKTFGGNHHDELESIQLTLDGGYIVAGETFSFGGGSFDGKSWNFLILKLDINGNCCSDELVKEVTPTVKNANLMLQPELFPINLLIFQ